MTLTRTLSFLLASTSYLLVCAASPAPAPSGAAPAAPADSISYAATTDSLPDADYTQLEDFVVTQRRKIVQNDGAKLTYNVSEDPEAGSSTMIEILRKVPGVTVDADDNIRVNGSTNFKVYRNGRDDPMFSGSDLKNILKSLPANTIKKIEVISEPGAKYEAEGAGGILNIVTDRTIDLSGFMLNINAWANAMHVGGNVSGRVKLNKVMLDAGITYNNGHVWPRTMKSSGSIEDLTGARDHLTLLHGRSRSGWGFVSPRLNLSWEPDTLNLFTFSAYYNNNDWKSSTHEHRATFDAGLKELWRYHRRSDNHGSWNGSGLTASYQHNFGRESHNIVASYMLSYNTDDGHTDYTLVESEGDVAAMPWQRNSSDGWTVNHIGQFDYFNQLSPKHLLEAGFKGSFADNNDNSVMSSGPDSEQAIVDEASRVNVRQFKDIMALYGSYTGSFGKFSVKAGLRYEFTHMGLRYKTGDFENYTTDLHDLVPNGALSWNFAPSTSLRLAYQMRINRPSLHTLNPYVDRTTPGQISYGNPHLKSEMAHNLSLGYTNYEGKFGGSAKMIWRHNDNSIVDIIFMRDNLINSTYANVGKEDALRFDFDFHWNISNSLRWYTFWSASWMLARARSELLTATRAGWQTTLSSNISWTMPCKVRLSAYGGFWTPWMDLQTRGQDTGYYYGIGASRSFLKKDALNVAVNASNFLPWYRYSGWKQTSQTVVMESRTRHPQWNFSISISYRIGGLTANVKQTAASVEQEADAQTSGNK